MVRTAQRVIDTVDVYCCLITRGGSPFFLPRYLLHHQNYFPTAKRRTLGIREGIISISPANHGIRRRFYLLLSLSSLRLQSFKILVISRIICRYITSSAVSNLQISKWSFSAGIRVSFGSPSSADSLSTSYEICTVSEASSISKNYSGLTSSPGNSV